MADTSATHQRDASPTDICLVVPPFDAIIFPALGTSVLASALKARGLKTRIVYGSILLAARVGSNPYRFICNSSQRQLAGEKLFAAHAYGPEERAAMGLSEPRARSAQIGKVAAAIAPFLDTLVRQILASKPKIVGITTNFQQNMAAHRHRPPHQGAGAGDLRRARGGQCRLADGRRAGEGLPLDRPFLLGRGRHRLSRFLRALRARRRQAGAEAHPLPADRRHARRPRARLQRLFRRHRALSEARQAAAGAARVHHHGNLARLLVGRDASLHLLRPQRRGHGLPQEGRRYRLCGDARADRALEGGQDPRRRQHHAAELPRRSAAQARRMAGASQAVLRGEGEPARRATRHHGARRRRFDPAGHRVAVVQRAEDHAQGRGRRCRTCRCCAPAARAASMCCGTSSTAFPASASRITRQPWR